jgi:hypothetical protein
VPDYEVEFGSVTERRDARTGSVDRVEVVVHVRRVRAERGVGEPQSGEYRVTFDVADGRARFREIETDTAYDDLGLTAIRAAATEIAAVQDSYEVESPLQAVQQRESVRHDQQP